MKVLVIGCGRLGSELAGHMYSRGHQITVIDSISAAFSNLPENFQGRLIEGDAISQDVLNRANIQSMDAVAAVTSSDELNLVAGRISKIVFRAPTVIVRNYDPACRELFEIFGLQVISSTSWGAQRIEEMLTYTDVRPVFSAGNGEVEIFELPIPPDWEGRRLSDLVNEQAYASSVTRAGRAHLPSPGFLLAEGDLVHMSATVDGIEVVRSLICGPKKER
jgi:trk system potassium uptake protein TrkA